nr:sugar transferase [uncultured Halomonas sp.]
MLFSSFKQHLSSPTTEGTAAGMGGAKVRETAHIHQDHHPLLEHQRRHSQLLERLLISNVIQVVIGWVLTVMIPAIAIWGWGYWENIGPEQWAALISCSVTYSLAIFSVHKLANLPHVKSYFLVLPSITLCYFLMLIMLLVTAINVDYSFVLVSYLVGSGIGFLSCLGVYFISRKKFAVVPFGKTTALHENSGAGWCLLDRPSLANIRVNGVVADLQVDHSDVWKRFLADCTIYRIPVYSAGNAMEMTCGKIPLDSLQEEVRRGSLSPHEGYEALKRAIDVTTVLLIMPLVLPLMAVAMIAIRLDSPGAAIFKQRRMGLCCRQFTVYKFRSMYTDRVGKGFTVDGEDPRVTPVGKVIRKYRIDELPQLFNVLKGDMSLIGPRPESMELTDWYAKDVPYFHYRHVVRPGISGWAQVMQGYAADVDGMIGKLEYDFYYIKNFSFWLDALIVIRTFKTLITGFGSR